MWPHYYSTLPQYIKVYGIPIHENQIAQIGDGGMRDEGMRGKFFHYFFFNLRPLILGYYFHNSMPIDTKPKVNLKCI